MDKDIHFRSRVSLDNSFSQPTNYTHCKLRLGSAQAALLLANSTIHCLLIGQLRQIDEISFNACRCLNGVNFSVQGLIPVRCDCSNDSRDKKSDDENLASSGATS